MNPSEPDDQRAACRTTGRRRAANQRQGAGRGRQPRDVCPQRRRLPDPAHEAFVEWFVAYWRRRGAQLFTDHPAGEEMLHV